MGRIQNRLCSSQKGFTLLEVLAVISVMVILASFALPSLRISRRRGFETKTKAQLVAVSLALKMYQADMGEFPSLLNAQRLMYGFEEDNTTPLGARWQGPYIELKLKNGVSKAGKILDGWGQPLLYKKHSALKDGRFFDLYSLGSDGKEGSVNGVEDDIKYWMD